MIRTAALTRWYHPMPSLPVEDHSEQISEDRSNAGKHEQSAKPNPERREDELHYFEHRKFLSKTLCCHHHQFGS